MKFPNDHEVETIRGNQRGTRECYLGSIRKAKPWDVKVIIVDMDMIDVPGEPGHKHEDVEIIDTPVEHEEVFIHDEVDPLFLC